MESLRSGQCQIGGVNKQKHFILLKYICHHLDLIGKLNKQSFQKSGRFLSAFIICVYVLGAYICLHVCIILCVHIF